MSDSLVEAARKSLTTAVGLGLLVVQNAQVQRRELTKAAPKVAAEIGVVVGDRVKTLAEKLADLDDRADDIFDDFEQRLPETLRGPVRQFHEAVRDLRGLGDRRNGSD